MVLTLVLRFVSDSPCPIFWEREWGEGDFQREIQLESQACLAQINQPNKASLVLLSRTMLYEELRLF